MSNDSTDSVYVVHHDGAFHVMNSVACFPADGSGSDDANAAAEKLRGMTGGATITKVDTHSLNKAMILLVVPGGN